MEHNKTVTYAASSIATIEVSDELGDLSLDDLGIDDLFSEPVANKEDNENDIKAALAKFDFSL